MPCYLQLLSIRNDSKPITHYKFIYAFIALNTRSRAKAASVNQEENQAGIANEERSFVRSGEGAKKGAKHKQNLDTIITEGLPSANPTAVPEKKKKKQL